MVQEMPRPRSTKLDRTWRSFSYITLPSPRAWVSRYGSYGTPGGPGPQLPPQFHGVVVDIRHRTLPVVGNGLQGLAIDTGEQHGGGLPLVCQLRDGFMQVDGVLLDSWDLAQGREDLVVKRLHRVLRLLVDAFLMLRQVPGACYHPLDIAHVHCHLKTAVAQEASGWGEGRVVALEAFGNSEMPSREVFLVGLPAAMLAVEAVRH